MGDTFSIRNINATIGALEVGILICMFLLGVSTVQAYVYYSRFQLDNWKIKAMVASVLALEWAHSICIAHTFYTITVLEYGHIEKLVTTSISLRISIIFCSAVSSMVQMFFANRVRRFTGKPHIAIFCYVLIVWRVGVGMVAAAGAMENTNIIVFKAKYKWIMMFYALGTTIDLTIAISLCYSLIKHRKTSIKKTVRLIDSLIAWTIETGAMTGLSSAALLVCFESMPDNFIWLAIYFYIDRLYSNSLFSILIARASRSRMQNLVIESTGEGLKTSIAPRFAPVITTTQQLDTAQSRSGYTDHFVVEMVKQSDITESHSSSTGLDLPSAINFTALDVIQKDEFLCEEKRLGK